MSQDEVESQLSAMFDGELPAAECELLSRRIDRDENLRARWSRYALIGAAMRSEPVATARSGFATRVSAALDAGARSTRRGRGSLLLSAALAATLVVSVAGLSVSMLREAALGTGAATLTAAATPPQAIAPTASEVVEPASAVPGAGEASALEVTNRGPVSYITPAGTPNAATILRTQLADYIVAHSAYSTPLLRRNVLSELVTSEDPVGIVSSSAGAGGGGDASRSKSVPRH